MAINMFERKKGSAGDITDVADVAAESVSSAGPGIEIGRAHV